MKPVRILHAAEQDLSEATEFDKARSHVAALTLVLSFEKALTEICAFPLVGKIVYRQTRARRLSRVPYSLLYRDEPDEIVVVALSHLSRHPNHWKDRF